MSCDKCTSGINVTLSGGSSARRFPASTMRVTPEGRLNLFDDVPALVATIASGYWSVAEYVEAQSVCRCGFRLVHDHGVAE